jgi:hypothetical protein
MVLVCAEPSATNLSVSRTMGVSRRTAATSRGRFAAHRLEGLVDAPRCGALRSISDATVERLFALTLEEPLSNATYWSTRIMARRVEMSQREAARDRSTGGPSRQCEKKNMRRGNEGHYEEDGWRRSARPSKMQLGLYFFSLTFNSRRPAEFPLNFSYLFP